MVINKLTGTSAELDAETSAVDKVVESLLFDKFNHLWFYALLQLSRQHTST